MLNHVGIKISNYVASRDFYAKVLPLLGYALLMQVTPQMTGTDARHARFVANGKPSFWTGTSGATSNGAHVAFVVASRTQVDAFPAAAIAADARNNGAPGPRPHCLPGYDGAFVLDPDGHNIEAVCHRPEA